MGLIANLYTVVGSLLQFSYVPNGAKLVIVIKEV